MNKIIIFDTTLRDGEQAVGSSLDFHEKLEIARQLEKLGVDVIEAGFPISSAGEFRAVQLISKEIRRSVICALCHANAEAIDRAWEAIKEAAHPRIHVFLSVSDIHLLYQLNKSREEVLEKTRKMVTHAKCYTDDIEFSPMDASRADPSYLHRIIEVAISAGATTVNIPDTVGYSTPTEFGELIQGIVLNVPNISQAIISVHCHNDLGLATANSLAALCNGARQVECTINGIGERAGNAALEEIVMALKTRYDLLNFTTDVDTTQIYKTSRLVSDLIGFPIQPNKAIVGANAFSHQSGIHQDGLIKKAITYEIMDPKSIGLSSSNLVLGKSSGRHAFKERLAELGYTLAETELKNAFQSFKEIADKKKEVTDRDIEALVAEEHRTAIGAYHLDHVEVICGDHSLPTATVRLIGPDGKCLADAALGAGPVDAIGEVLIKIESDGVSYTGRGASTDIVVATAKAYMNALNRLLSKKITNREDAS